MTEVTVEGVTLSHPDRVFYPSLGTSKEDLARYYEEVKAWVLPHISDRPVTLVRCPDGVPGDCFFQKHPNQAVPPQLEVIEIQEKQGSGKYMIVAGISSIIAAVQVGALELHVWASRRDRIDRPDRMIFDLDPGEGVRTKQIHEAAHELRARLQKIGLESFALLTGGKGVHVVVPLERRHDFSTVKAFARAVARQLCETWPERFVGTPSKAARRNRIFVDTLRNDRGATAIAPYSTRAHPGASVATPMRWDELDSSVRSDAYDLDNVRQRLAQLNEDPWAHYFDHRQRLSASTMKSVGA